MIPGRPNVGDAQSRRLLAIMDVRQNKTVWADASRVRRRRAQGEARRSRRASTAQLVHARRVGRRAAECRGGAIARQQGPLVREGRSGNRQGISSRRPPRRRLDSRAGRSADRADSAAARASRGCRTTNASCFCRRRKATSTCTRSMSTAATPQARALTSGKWEVTSAQLSNDRKTVFLTTNEVHPGERQFYTMSVDGGARTRVTTATGIERSDRVAGREGARGHLFLQHQTAGAVRDAADGRRAAEAGHDVADRGMARLQVDRPEGDHLQDARRRRTCTRGCSRRR